MQIKTFRGKSYSRLIKEIKSELGPDAVILSSDCVSTNGKKTYEVVAALENGTEPQAAENDRADLISRPDASQGDNDWRLEWENFKNSFYKIIKNNVPGPNITKRQKQVLEYLENQGVYPEVIMDLWSSMAENIHMPTLKVLGDTVPTSSWEKHLSQGRVHAFMGPSGAGKTTTVLRLALEARKNNPNWKICLVNTDTQHAGGRLYLKHYASLSGLNYLEAKSAADWQDLVMKKTAFDLILIDTPGFGGESETISRDIEELLDVQGHLILSPVYGPSQIDHYISISRRSNAISIIWTKIDEACNYGVVVNASWKSKLPVSYLSYGKGLKQCSCSADQESLWMLIFKKRLPGNINAPG